MKIVRTMVSAAACLSMLTASAQAFHCPSDTVKAMEIIRDFREPGADPSAKCGEIAMVFVGTPYEPVTEIDSLAHNVIRLDAFDDMSFLNAVTAIARQAVSPGHIRPLEFSDELRNLTYRRGEDHGFPSKMVYAADWIVDNKSRGLVKEITENYSDSFKTKSLDFVTRNRGKYASLKDSSTYEAQKMVEMGFRTHKIPHMKRESSGNKDVAADLREGDIVMVLTNDPLLDTLTIGFLKKRDDGMHLIHVSREAGKVVEEEEPLPRFMKRNAKNTYGWRWLRIL